jgi:hypothetical protein
MSSLLPGEGRARARWLPRHGRQPSHPTRPVLLSPRSSTAGGLSPGVVARTMGQLLRDITVVAGGMVTILSSQRERRGRPLLGHALRGRQGFTPSMASLPWSSQRAWGWCLRPGLVYASLEEVPSVRALPLPRWNTTRFPQSRTRGCERQGGVAVGVCPPVLARQVGTPGDALSTRGTAGKRRGYRRPAPPAAPGRQSGPHGPWASSVGY